MSAITAPRDGVCNEHCAGGRLYPQPRVYRPKPDHGRAHVLSETQARGLGEQPPSTHTHSRVLSP